MNPTTPTRPRHASQLPPGVAPGPVTVPHRPPAPAPPARPATRQPPATTTQRLCTLLRGNGLTGLYSYTHTDVAVISLPMLTVWVRPATLSWAHDGQHTIWPASDLPGAARHLTRLHQPARTAGHPVAEGTGS